MEDSTQILVLVVVATGVMILLAGSVIFFVLFYQKRMLSNKLQMQNLETEYQKQLLEATIDSQENERNRVGSELHDSVGAMLSTIRLNLKMASSDHTKLTEAASDITQYLDETIETVRSISRDLYPAGLKTFGLSGVVRELLERINKLNQLKVEFIEKNNAIRLSQKQELMIYRIIQELVNNALKHSRAHEIKIEFDWQNDELLINVSDDGIGFTSDQLDPTKRGIGLYNIANRAAVINAKVEFRNLENSGANIILTVPYSGMENEGKED